MCLFSLAYARAAQGRILRSKASVEVQAGAVHAGLQVTPLHRPESGLGQGACSLGTCDMSIIVHAYARAGDKRQCRRQSSPGQDGGEEAKAGAADANLQGIAVGRYESGERACSLGF